MATILSDLPTSDRLFMDEHHVHALVLLGLAVVGAGNTLGLGRMWTNTTLLRSHPWLT